ADAAGVLGVPCQEALDRRDEGGDRAFHIGGAAAVESAVAYDGGERVALPGIERTRRDHVDMPGEREERRAVAALRPEILDRAEAQAFDRESERPQALGD